MSTRFLSQKSRHLPKNSVTASDFHVRDPKISEAEHIAGRMAEDADEAREKRKREPGPVTIRRFSWEG